MPRLRRASPAFADCTNFMYSGMAMAARMPRMTTTIISSTRVKPFLPFFIFVSSFKKPRWGTAATLARPVADRHQRGSFTTPMMFCLLER